MALYTFLSFVFPQSFVAKLVAISMLSASASVLFVVVPLSVATDSVSAVFVLVGMAIFGVSTGFAFRAVLAPLHALENNLKALETCDAVVRLTDVRSDLPGQLMRQFDRLLRDTETRVDAARRLAERDPLTGLLNRRGLERALEGVPNGSLLALDLDHFKAVNDMHGHAEGDRLLADLATTLRCVLRHSDLAARMGGEEFVVVLPSLGIDAAHQIAQRIRKSVEDRLLVSEGPVTVSIGVAPKGSGCKTDWSNMMRRADGAVYEAKARGRNCVVVWGSERSRGFSDLPHLQDLAAE